MLLALFAVTTIVALYLVVVGARSGQTGDQLQAVVAALPAAGLLVWYRYVQEGAKKIGHDLVQLAATLRKAEKRQ